MKYRSRVTAAGVAMATLALAGCGGAGGTGNSGDSAKIAMQTGSDRTKALTAGAKKEKHLLWYTTMIPDQLVEPLVKAFEAKYPYIKVDYYRGNSTDVAQKTVQEYKSRRYKVDLVDGTGTSSLLKEAGVLQPFKSPQLADYPADLKASDGYWGTELQYFMALAYNTKSVKPSEAPKTYEDLLDPRWKGKMAWSTSDTSGGPLFLGNLIDAWGKTKADAYIHKLAGQKIANLDSSGRAVIDQVVSGQQPIALEVFNDQVEVSKAKGAPVDWVPLNPVTAQLSRISLVKQPPHPNAAMLFLDFMFSEAGQKIIQAGGGIPGKPGVDAEVPKLKPEKGGFKAQYMDPDTTFKQTTQWSEIYKQNFVG
ncbi:ABC transporter substrate-binding protein [Streptomyces sp. NPDC050560]|uniref:ABC transporter substrate-binding protein n=1 Tax=Streptomyces sp. NPDC050560 TaxID=3365630 RepID=UPI0037ACDBF1